MLSVKFRDILDDLFRWITGTRFQNPSAIDLVNPEQRQAAPCGNIFHRSLVNAVYIPGGTTDRGGVKYLPEFRQDLISGRWVIIATDRARRPDTFACKGKNEIDYAALPAYEQSCPFCPGNEAMTPPGLLTLGCGGAAATGSADWRVRVVPNKYPALEPRGDPSPALENGCEVLFQKMPGYGVHEVIIETPQHNRHPGSLAAEQVELVVEAYYRRSAALAGNRHLRFLQIFRNHGRQAGASIEHPHSQLVALPFVPALMQQELDRVHRYFLEHGDCPYCRLLDEERDYGKRMIAENESFSAYMPYASRCPFETWLLPRRHQSSFLEMEREERSAFADIFNRVLGRLARALADPPYNYYLHSAPVRTAALPHFHWHLEIAPKLTTAAGFEMGSGVFINVTLPEEAAAFIRDKGESDNESNEKDLFCDGFAQSPTGGQSQRGF